MEKVRRGMNDGEKRHDTVNSKDGWLEDLKRLEIEKRYKMKKLITMVLAAVMVFSMLAGCGEKTPETVSEVVNAAALNGPTGMAMVQLMDMEDKYNITTYQAPTDVTAKVINGEVDVAAVPSNLAAVLYNKTKGEIVAISPIALGMLQIIGNDVDLKNVSDLKGI